MRIDDDEEDWKVKAEELDSEIDEGEMSDGDGDCRIRAKKFNRDFKVVRVIGYCNLDRN